MMKRMILGAVLASAALATSVHAKKPAASDESELRGFIANVYKSYTTPIPEAPEDGSNAPDNPAGAAMDGYELPYTKSLEALINRWSKLMQATDELYGLNSYDWYCQCQDNDNKTAKLLKQSYNLVAKDRIDAKILYSAGFYQGRHHGAPLTFRFKREGGAWKLDDLRFESGSMLRADLASDIKDAERDAATK